MMVVLAFKNHSIVPWELRNRWLNGINATKTIFVQIHLSLVPNLFASYLSGILSLF